MARFNQSRFWGLAMKIEDAIKAHAQWKVKLTAYLMHPDGSLNPAAIAQDHLCELGKWVHGDAKRHSHLPEMVALRETHAQFHRAAAEVVRKIDSGAEHDQNKLTGFSSEFGVLSLKIVNQLKSLAAKIDIAH